MIDFARQMPVTAFYERRALLPPPRGNVDVWRDRYETSYVK